MLIFDLFSFPRKCCLLLSGVLFLSITPVFCSANIPFQDAQAKYSEGAVGSLSHDENGGLFVEKNNGKGRVEIEFPEYELAPGPERLVVLSFRTSLWNYGSFLNLQAELVPESGTPASLRSAQTTSILLPDVEFEPNKRFLALPASTVSKTLKISLEVLGNPCQVKIDELAVRDLSEGVRGIKDFLSDVQIPADEAAGLLKEKQALSAFIEKSRPQAFLDVKGKEVAPVLYTSHPEPLASQFQLFSKLGVKTQVVNIPVGPYQRIGAEIYPGVWVGQGEYNFKLLDDLINRALQSAPDAALVLSLGITPYPAWGDENPDEVIANDKGEKGIGIGPHNVAFRTERVDKLREYWCPSLSSDKYLSDVQDLLIQFFAHAKQQPYYKAVIGFFILGGDDGQWQPWARSGWANRGDYSPAGLKGFRRWLQEKYGTEEGLQKAWGKKKDFSFDDVVVPTTAERAGSGPFLDPVSERALIDYTAYESTSKAILVDRIARTIKSLAEKQVLVGCYFQDQLYGHTFCYEESPRINSPSLDFFVSPLDYGPWRRAGWIGGEFSVSPDSLKLHEKLYLCELDFRTEGSRKTSEYYDYSVIGALDAKESFDAVNFRSTGLMLNYGMGQWYYELAAGSFAVDYAQEGIERAVDIYDEVLSAKEAKFKPRIAVFADGSVNSYVSPVYQDPLLMPALNIARSSLFMSGASMAIYGMEDLMNPKLPDYSMYVFLNSWYLSSEQRRFIKENLQKNGKTIVWVGPAGYMDETGASLSRVSDIVGMKFAQNATFRRLLVESRETAAEPFSRLLPRQGTAWQDLFGLNIKVEDKNAVPIGWYLGGNEVANAIKRNKDYTVAFVATPGGLGPDLLNAICRYSNIPTEADFGNGVVFKNDILTLHGVAGGQARIRFQKPVKLVNLLEKQDDISDTKEFVVDLKPGDTKLYKVSEGQK